MSEPVSARVACLLCPPHHPVVAANVFASTSHNAALKANDMSDPKAGVVKTADAVPETTVSAGRNTRFQLLVGPADGAPHFALRRFIMEQGGGIPMHTNQVEHEQYVLRGRATVRIGDDVHQVGPDDALYIPAGTPHSYDVIEGPFEFICVVPNLPDEIKLQNC